MPTTIYSSSLITQRSRDKIIAQEVQQRNSRGIPIITPQSGYGAYTVEDKDNGSINEYRQNGSCMNVDKACACSVIPKIPLIPDSIWINHTVSSTSTELRTIQQSRFNRLPLNNTRFPVILSNTTVTSNPLNQITVTIVGYGTIDWDDGTITSFDSSIDVDNTHTYSTTVPSNYTIKLYGIIYALYTSYLPESGGDLNYPDVNFIQMNDIHNLTTLVCVNQNINAINNFDKCTNLTTFITANNNLSIYNTLTLFKNLTDLGLGNMPNTITTDTFNCADFPSLTGLYIPNNAIINITNLPNNIAYLYAYNTNITGLSPVPLLITFLALDGCKIEQNAANSIASALVSNGQFNGNLSIVSQDTGDIVITSDPWVTLINTNRWNIV